MRRFLLILLLHATIGTALALQTFVPHRGTVPDSYNFWFYNPEPEAEVGAHFPLVIFLHGQSLCGSNLDRVKRYGPIAAATQGLHIYSYMIAPQNPGGAWNPDKIMKLVDWAVEHFPVDTTRVYVYGMSLGGYGTIDLAATYPDRIAAAMALCGGGSVKDLTGLSKVPLWIIHGTADRAVPISASERVVEIIRQTGDDSRLLFTRLPGADHGRPARLFYMHMTFDWLFSHSLADPGRPVFRDFEITNELLNDAYNELRRFNIEAEEY